MTDHEYARCDRFVDTVVTNHLDEFAAKCFEEEHDFQKEALRLLCRLYRDCPKEEKTLRKQLKEILRMLVVTHIVSTTFGIPDACARTVLPRLQQGGHPAQFGSYPSPRVASHQLKFYFSRVRHDAYHKILKYLNSLLKAATDKSLTWLTTFCIILGFAMVLEDCQQLVHVRSNARVTRHQRDAFTASQETIMECRNIDEQFQFLVALFHNKYHKRNVTFAKLSDYIDTRPQDGPEIAFIHGLQNLMAAQADYLRMQKSTTIPVDHRQQYTSRLIARFLDNFMGLQLGSQGHISHLP
ncbi:Hypothetical protein D9617_10g073390 [Elsinoe fawcettii]|nr:Hypothetical protein D9617_10g073390 [Elsinoe fawcettii]